MSTGVHARRHKRSANIRRKNLNIDQEKLDRVVKLLGAKSETEAIDRLLDEALFREELLASVEQIAGKGGMENYFEGGYAEDWDLT